MNRVRVLEGQVKRLPLFVSLDASEVTLEEKELEGIARVRCYSAKTQQDIPDEIEEADVVAVWHTIWITPELLARMKRCKLIVRMGVGFDNVDRAAAGKHGIPVCNVPNYGTEEVADTALALTLSFARRTHHLGGLVAKGVRVQGPDAIAAAAGPACQRVRGKTFGVVGFGRIGIAIALRAKVFGFRVVFYDPFVVDGMDKAVGVERQESLEGLLRISDYVSLSVNAVARGEFCNLKMINRDALKEVKRGAVLINTARGEVVDDEALLEALEDGRLGGAALDVHWGEPFVRGDSDAKAGSSSSVLGGERGGRLIDEGKLICTPHAAWYSTDSRREMRMLGIKTVKRCLAGEAVRNCVNTKLIEGTPRCAFMSLEYPQ
eukprot:Hpha_TRINITY_DN5164_c0_g1::TRINITY_DN5164_c0_g1_i1::g.193105::m.193105/K04496/CTBP; C-terminal binding protein